MTGQSFVDKELREIGEYYRNLWRAIEKIRDLVSEEYDAKEGGTIKILGREIDRISVTTILQEFVRSKKKYEVTECLPEVESFWMNGSSKKAREEIIKTEKFLELISGIKLKRPEAVKKFFGEEGA